MNSPQHSTLPDPEAIGRLFDLTGKRAVVTGAASGIGRAIAWGFACRGADVAIFDRNVDAARDCAQEIARLSGRQVVAVHGDTSDEADVARVFHEVGQALGPVNVLVNGAGHNIRKPLVEMTQAEFDSILAVHVRGAFLCCRSVGRSMCERRDGSIINIASIAGHVGIPNVAAYAAAKGALVQLSKAMALEMAPFGVRVNSLAPGYIETPLTRQNPESTRRRIEEVTPLGRFGRADEIVGPALFLASEASSFVTGASLLVDGGWTAQ